MTEEPKATKDWPEIPKEVYRTTPKEKVIKFLTQETPLLITATLFTLVAIFTTGINGQIALLGLSVLARYYIRRQRKEKEQ